ncbi:MAG: hypothetical protein QM541_04055 [Flavobacterium sp.]|nr:hypothetical protein [Flavobacterium sp.]
MDALLKQEIHQLIENCDDDVLLNEAKAILASIWVFNYLKSRNYFLIR